METINDEFSILKSVVRFKPTSNVSFIADELKRYGIKTNKEAKDKKIFYQSAHIISKVLDDNEIEFGIVSFKDLFYAIGKNDNGLEDQDRMRVWVIAQKLEKRGMIEITGTHDSYIGEDEAPDDLPDCFANLCHIYRKSDEINDYAYKSKFATNKCYEIQNDDESLLVGVGEFFSII